MGYPGGSDGKASARNAGEPGSISGQDPWKMELATHSSTLAWRIPWMEEPGRLQSMRSEKTLLEILRDFCCFVLFYFLIQHKSIRAF